MARSPSRCLAPALGLLVLVGCGGSEIVSAPSHDLSEPWQAQPFAVDPVLVAAGERICRDPRLAMFALGTKLVVVDARGGNRLVLHFVGPIADGPCFLTREPAGRLVLDGGGGGSGPPHQGLEPTEVMIRGAGSLDSSSGPNDEGQSIGYVYGEAGAAVVNAEVRLPSGASLLTSLNGGSFVAWWPGKDTEVVVRGYNDAAISSARGREHP